MANLGYIQLARCCNQRCRFCSNPSNGRILSLEAAKDHVDDFVQRGYDGIILTGGEPTLFPAMTELIHYAKKLGLPTRIITNGQNTADPVYLADLASAGLTHLHLSIYSVRESVNDYLTQKPGSLKNQLKTLENLADLDIQTDINCVLNRHNADHLDENVRVLTQRFPFLNHFVWNNLDPTMNTAMDYEDVVPRLRDFEVSLFRAMRFLDRTGRTFRVERVPLCYMAEYAHCSTETRKIIKSEERIVHFLDDKETVRQTQWDHGKAEVCSVCHFNAICAGLYELGNFYDPVELSPVFLDPRPVVERVRGKGSL